GDHCVADREFERLAGRLARRHSVVGLVAEFQYGCAHGLWAAKRNPYASRVLDSRLHWAGSFQTSVARMDPGAADVGGASEADWSGVCLPAARILGRRPVRDNARAGITQPAVTS